MTHNYGLPHTTHLSESSHQIDAELGSLQPKWFVEGMGWLLLELALLLVVVSQPSWWGYEQVVPVSNARMIHCMVVPRSAREQ